jgi:histidyl-tRNA synthetase
MTEREPLSTEPYKGVRDFYPEELVVRRAVFDKIRQNLLLRGFEEYDASPLERAELYEKKTSEEIVNGQTYTFTDRGDRRVTLRPEMTPSLARMVAAKRKELVFPVRWFNIGNRFRYERPQKGRLREFYQVDVDIIGIADEKAEGEAVVIAYDLLKSFGAKDENFSIKINSRSLLNLATSALGLFEDEAARYIALLDRKDKMPPEEFEQERSAFRKGGKDPLELIQGGGDAAVDAEKARLDALLAAFAARGMGNVVFDPTVVRGFLYYTGLVFEIFDTSGENPRALFGGGRYDGLISMFGGAPIPAIGFAFGDVTLMDFLSTHKLLPKATSAPDVFIGTPEVTDTGPAQAFAESLRARGIRTLVHVSGKALGDQVKEAVRRGIPYFIAYGKDEEKKGKVRVKDLAKSAEKTVSKKDAAKLVLKAVGR